jgi:hypothetical protein
MLVGKFYQTSWLIETGLTLHFRYERKPCLSYSQSSQFYNCHNIPFGLPEIPAEVNIPDKLDLDFMPDTCVDKQDGDGAAVDGTDDITFLDPHEQAK